MKTKLILILTLLAGAFSIVPAISAQEPTQKDIAEWRAAANRGEAWAQHNLGVCYANGYGVAQDYREAVKWWRKSAEQGEAAAQYNLGVCYENGRGVEQDYREAVKWWRKSAEQGGAAAQYNLGVCYANGYGVAQDYREAVKWYRKAAEQGNASAQCNLGNSYYRGRGVAQDYREAVKWWRKSAEQGDAYAQFPLGLCYENGIGVGQDYREAVKWYRKSAEQGGASAQYNLGVCYAKGRGVEQDYREAVKWYRRSAEQGDADAQFNLGVSYQYGKGVEQDYREAVKWYRKAAEQGGAKAQFNLGVCYANGDGVERDNREAVKWFRKAADQGDASAQNNLGICYENGKSVPQDYAEAAWWYRKAAEQGDATAQKNLDALYANEKIDKRRLGVDFFVPESGRLRKNVFVCIIANEDYGAAGSGLAKVDFAANDGEIFAEYARKTLGVPARNIFRETNATGGKMRSVLRRLEQAAKLYPNAEIVFYYAGHGVPVMKGGRAAKTCLLPTDVPAEDASEGGVALDELLERLRGIGAQRVTVFLDACFSGMTRGNAPQVAARGARIEAPTAEACGNMAVFSAASGDETAQSLDGKRHGLFTYCLLEKLQETKGEVSCRELGEYLRRRVPQAAHENGLPVTQTPTLRVSGGFDLDRKLTED